MMSHTSVLRHICNSRMHPLLNGFKVVRKTLSLRATVPARSATGAQRAPLTEPDRVLPPATRSYCLGWRQEGADRAHRHRDRNQQPVRKAHRQRSHLLQLGHPVATADEVRGERQCQSTRTHHPDITSGLAAHPVERALHLPERRQDDRPGCARGGARSWVTEISAVPAYNPYMLSRFVPV